MTLKSFFDRLSRQQIISIPLHHFSLIIAYLFAGPANDDSDEICYLQSQNGNIERFDYVNLVDENGDEDEDSPELSVLQSYLKTDVACVTEALGKCSREISCCWATHRMYLGRKPDAVNLWIGDSRSVTSLHKG